MINNKINILTRASPAMASESLLAVLSLTDFTPQAHGDRCSFHPGVFQGIVFSPRKLERER
jgi:hypothetical protein